MRTGMTYAEAIYKCVGTGTGCTRAIAPDYAASHNNTPSGPRKYVTLQCVIHTNVTLHRFSSTSIGVKARYPAILGAILGWKRGRKQSEIDT